MRRIARVAALVLLAFTMTVGVVRAEPANQLLREQALTNDVTTGVFTWSGSAQTCTGNACNQIVTKSLYTSWITNTGSCSGGTKGSTSYAMTYGDMVACAVNASLHTPILANNTFSAGATTSWTITGPTYGAGCSSGATAFTGINATDQDGDSGFVEGTSGTACVGGTDTATTSIAQTVSIVGTPTNQSWSLWLLAPQATAGISTCTIGRGNLTLTVMINATQVYSGTGGYPTGWTQLSGTTTALVNGSNTVTLQAIVSGAAGATNFPLCTIIAVSSQAVSVDDVKLVATY